MSKFEKPELAIIWTAMMDIKSRYEQERAKYRKKQDEWKIWNDRAQIAQTILHKLNK